MGDLFLSANEERNQGQRNRHAKAGDNTAGGKKAYGESENVDGEVNATEDLGAGRALLTGKRRFSFALLDITVGIWPTW